MSVDLRPGELVVQCAGGKCAVCKQRIEPGQAVQLSSMTSSIRHTTCMPKEDSRERPRRDRVKKEITDDDA